jgi:hypothetical protein
MHNEEIFRLSETRLSKYYKRPPIEAVNSFLKTQYSMVVNNVRGLKQVAIQESIAGC